ncbi:centromere protein V [Echria macrotheca]|uniref:Centromere protein V n=1 Tax=Echria macrotheca TaxID=438768 RepID=A0AAJ0BPZ3_9PEZI|nr:centromere protein V [Echria macrotheca]
MASQDANLKTYTGGCHCGAVRYSIEADLSGQPKASKCNCSICLKTNRLSLTVDRANFKLLSPASLDEVPSYQFSTRQQHHKFCDKCGIHCFLMGSYVYEGKTYHNFSVNAVTLDPDQGFDLREFKVTYWDGKAENWAAGQMEKPAAGGCY